MTISPIGLQTDVAARQPTSDAGRSNTTGNGTTPVRPAVSLGVPATRTVSVDLPEPMPGRLQLDVDNETGRVIGRIIEKESGRLIRQIPSDEALKLAASVKHLLKPLFTAEV